MRTFVTIIVLIVSANIAAQSMKEQYGVIAATGSPEAIESFFSKWEESNPADPELYNTAFNYYVEKSRILYSPGFDRQAMSKALDYAERGIGRFPSRLDMRFGKTAVYLLLKDYAKYTEEIIKTLDYSAKIGNKWSWSDNKPLDNGQKTMIDGMQGYIMQLFETGDEKKLPHMLRIAETTFDYYPGDSGSLVNLAIVYLLWGQYDDALEFLKEAENISPGDFQVLGNIAQVYRKKGDLQSAKKYYNRIIEVCDDEAKTYAKQQIEKLTP